jgi:mono/diheme cytochrome c family protein
VEFSAQDPWVFPAGTVFANHLGVSQEGGEFRKIETQILVRDPFSVGYLLSYRWNDEGSDAFLVEQSQSSHLSFCDSGGETRELDWYFASGQECLTCHRDQFRIVLGMTTAQLNRTVQTPDGVQNQLAHWSQRGLFSNSPSLPPRTIERLPRLVPVGDPDADVEQRVASLFTANCAHCHLIGRSETGRFLVGPPRQPPSSLLLGKRALREIDGKTRRLLAPGRPEQSAIYLRASSEHPGVRMPPVMQYALAADEIALLAKWIEELGRDSFPWSVTYYTKQGLSGKSQVTRARSADFDLDAELRFFPTFPRNRYSLRAETCLRAAEPTSLAVELSSPNQVQMFVDGEPAFQDPAAEKFGRQQVVLELAEGEHEVAIELTHHRGPGSLQLRSVLAEKSFSGFPTVLQCAR